MSRVIDTTLLYALFDVRDAHHADARAAFSDPERTLLDPVILMEWLQLVRHRNGRRASLDALEDLQRLPNVAMAIPSHPDAVARIMHNHGRLSWQDACCLATAQAAGARLLTADAQQQRVWAAMS